MKFVYFKTASVLLAGIVVGVAIGGVYMYKYTVKLQELTEADYMARTVAVLYHLREQSETNGINLLESQVDLSLAELAESPGALKNPDVQHVLSFTKKYRTKYPHTIDPTFRDSVTNLLANVKVAP